MAQPFVTGPCHIYCGVGSGLGPLYLGTCEAAPRIQMSPGWSPLMNDISGDQKPYDYLYQGQDAKVFGDLTVLNWPVLTIVQNRVPRGSPLPGLDPLGSVGTLMVTEGQAYPLWIHFPYGGATGSHAAMVTIPGGYHFFYAWLLGPDEIDPGTKANKVHVQFHCQKGPVTTIVGPTSPQGIAGATVLPTATGHFGLYDFNMTGIPAVPPIVSTG